MNSTGTLQLSEAEVQKRFRRLADEWKENSRYLSNSVQMAMLKPYQQIIGLGMAAVPLILEELRREPDHWFWALEAITGENLPQSTRARSDSWQKAGWSGGRNTV